MTDPTSQITMSNLPSTATEPIEEAVTSFVHSVRKYELRDQVYPLVGHTDYVHEFVASTTVLQHWEGVHVDQMNERCKWPFFLSNLLYQ